MNCGKCLVGNSLIQIYVSRPDSGVADISLPGLADLCCSLNRLVQVVKSPVHIQKGAVQWCRSHTDHVGLSLITLKKQNTNLRGYRQVKEDTNWYTGYRQVIEDTNRLQRSKTVYRGYTQVIEDIDRLQRIKTVYRGYRQFIEDIDRLQRSQTNYKRYKQFRKDTETGLLQRIYKGYRGYRQDTEITDMSKWIQTGHKGDLLLHLVW